MTDAEDSIEVPLEEPPSSATGDSGKEPPRIPAHHWRLLLPLLLLLLASATYVWQRQQQVDTEDFRLALAGQAETAARLDAAAQRAVRGEQSAFDLLRRLGTLAAAAQNESRAAFEASEPLRGQVEIAAALDQQDRNWQGLFSAADQLSQAARAGTTLRADVEAFQSIATGILVTTDELVDALVAAEESAPQVRAAARQLLLIQRISANVRRVLEGGDGVVTAADRFGRDAVLFGEVNIALLNGNEALGIQRVRAPEARELLVNINREFRRGSELIEQIMADAVAMVETRDAAARVGERAAAIISGVAQLQRRLARQAAARSPAPMLAEMFAVLAVFVLLVVMVHLAVSTRRARRAARDWAAEQARREMERGEREWRLEAREQATALAVRKLVDELDRLAKGDPSPESMLVEGISDTPLAPLEVAVRALRHRLGSVTRAAGNLAAATTGFGGAASRARLTVDEQAKQVEQAAAATRRMAAHVEAVGERVRKTERFGGENLTLVNQASASLQAAVSQSEKVLAAAKITAARVRQLDDATRQINEVGRLLDEISEQCRLLSLNVAIRATLNDAASGTHAAPFADEIKKLADNARRALRRIESVNEDVRNHAGQAADSVKQILWTADKSAAGGREAGKALASAAALAHRLEALNRHFADALEEHTRLMTDVVKATTAVHGVAGRARQEFRDVATSASRLSDLTALLDNALSGYARGAEARPALIELKAMSPESRAAPDDATGSDASDDGRDGAATPRQEAAGKD